MTVLLGLGVTALLAGVVTFFTNKKKIDKAFYHYHRLFEDLFLIPLFGQRPDPWTMHFGKCNYNRYAFPDYLKQALRDLDDRDYNECKLYNEGMRCAPKRVNYIPYYTVPHMLRQGHNWRLYDPVRWRYQFPSFYWFTILKNVRMDRELEQRWKYEVWKQQPRKGGLWQKIFGEAEPPVNYPPKGEKVFWYFPDYDGWFGPSTNNPKEARDAPVGLHQYLFYQTRYSWTLGLDYTDPKYDMFFAEDPRERWPHPNTYHRRWPRN